MKNDFLPKLSTIYQNCWFSLEFYIPDPHQVHTEPFSLLRTKKNKFLSHRFPWAPAASPAQHTSSHQDALVPQVPSRQIGWEILSAHRVSSEMPKANSVVSVTKVRAVGKHLNKTQQPPAGQTQQFKCTCLNQRVTTEKTGFPPSPGRP